MNCNPLASIELMRLLAAFSMDPFGVTSTAKNGEPL